MHHKTTLVHKCIIYPQILLIGKEGSYYCFTPWAISLKICLFVQFKKSVSLKNKCQGFCRNCHVKSLYQKHFTSYAKVLTVFLIINKYLFKNYAISMLLILPKNEKNICFKHFLFITLHQFARYLSHVWCLSDLLHY